jgi:hypothetical protein
VISRNPIIADTQKTCQPSPDRFQIYPYLVYLLATFKVSKICEMWREKLFDKVDSSFGMFLAPPKKFEFNIPPGVRIDQQ